jgi:alcohol dehydrogenase YqhD (iron-dependent ADH family)
MQNFVLHNQTKILFGKGMLDQLGTECLLYGKKALLVYGRESIKNTGLYEQITSLLSAQGVSFVDHGGVVSNPLLSHVHAGIKKAKAEQVDLILAVGGSVIDSAKAISCGALVDHDVWKFFTGKKSIKETLPLVCVLTLAAAGSEMNGGMVITHDEKKHKFGTGNNMLNPKTSILDPSLTITVPRDYTVYGAIDAIAHIVEFYFTTQEVAPVQERFMEGLIINIIDSCKRPRCWPQCRHAGMDAVYGRETSAEIQPVQSTYFQQCK